jgi:hypothetical protein
VKHRGKIFVLSLMSLSLVVIDVPGEAQKLDAIRHFDFEIQLQRPPQAAGSLVLDRGTLLIPIDPDDKSPPDDRKSYQSVVVCESVNVSFDELGRSRPFMVHGFCYDAKLPIPPARVVWEVGELVETSIRERCDLLSQVEAHRPKGVPSNWERLDRPCEDDRDPCHKRFDSFLKSEYQEGFDKFHERNLCLIELVKAEVAYVYELWCDKRNLGR